MRWEAEADFESGIQQFIIERDGTEIGKVPTQPKGSLGRALFQRMSYHDTPEKPLPEMRFIDRTAQPGFRHTYRVIAINGVGLKSSSAEIQLNR